MITLTMSLVPYGISMFGAHDLVRGRLWSAREQHRYALTLCGAGADGDLDLEGAGRPEHRDEVGDEPVRDAARKDRT